MDLFHEGAKRKRLGESPGRFGLIVNIRLHCGHKAKKCLTKSPRGTDTDRRGADLREGGNMDPVTGSSCFAHC